MKLENVSKEDIIRIIKEKNIKIVNLCHIPEDCRLKTLSFAVRKGKKLEEILKLGERVDGSSLFPYIDSNRSDVYITPKLDTLFFDPFSPMPALNIMCTYLDVNGRPLSIAPENILLRAEEKLHSTTGVFLKALTEIEFYVKNRDESARVAVVGNNYHETIPFAVFTHLRNEVLLTLEELGIATKYGHAEVGRFYTRTAQLMEQHEIELLPQNLIKTAEGTTIAKWVIRNLAQKFEAAVSFSPKLSLENAGSGMHLHLCGLKDGANILAEVNGGLTAEAKQIIGGILKFSPSLTAFGNTIPVSYLRFISRKESPMNISWGTMNRAALIRIPLWWNFERKNVKMNPCRRTIELRTPDPSANTYLLLAGIAVAIEYGLKNREEAMKITEDLNADESSGYGDFPILPLSCEEAADCLEKDRSYYEDSGIFPATLIDGTISKLRFYKDRGLWEGFKNKPDEINDVLQAYFDYG